MAARATAGWSCSPGGGGHLAHLDPPSPRRQAGFGPNPWTSRSVGQRARLARGVRDRPGLEPIMGRGARLGWVPGEGPCLPGHPAS